jgi:hypothetical protein
MKFHVNSIFIFIYYLTKNIASLLRRPLVNALTEIVVARVEVLTSVLIKIQMSRRVDLRIVTDVSKE